MLSRFLKLVMSSHPHSSSASRYAIAAASFTKRFDSPCFLLPSALAALFFFLLLTCNALSIFCFQIPFPLKPILDCDRHLRQNAVVIEFGESLSSSSSSSSFSSSSSSSSPSSSSSSSSLPSSIMYAVKEEAPLSRTRETLQLLHKHDAMVPPLNSSSRQRLRWFRRNRTKFKILQTSELSRHFSSRVQEFFDGAGGHGAVGNTTASSSSSSGASPHPCELRVFMTWISSLANFGDRGVFAIESLFKSNPDACLLIASKEMHSRRGYKLLRPFRSRGYRVMAASPDLVFLFESTSAEVWIEKLRKGNVDSGEVPLGQNLSNLLRLALLYKYGDEGTGRWTRLNNAVMIFDKNHPLVYKFIEEFALTFDGNKWGHNGPYLVSRVSEGPVLSFL